MDRTIKRGDIFYAELNPVIGEVKDVEGLDRDSIILLEQIRTIDKQRLKNQMGTMPDNIMARVDKALAISLDFSKKN